MASMSLREQRDAFVNSMISEGLLDQQQFSQLLMLEEDGSGFLVEVIMLFCDDSERIISELIKLLDQLVVDFQKVDSFVHQLKGSSSSFASFLAPTEHMPWNLGGVTPNIGAQNIKVACIHFRQSCEEHDKQGCLRALNAVKNEYYHLKAKFNTMVQLCREF